MKKIKFIRVLGVAAFCIHDAKEDFRNCGK
jgi:hypothetical protein